MSAFRVIEWRDTSVPRRVENWYELRFQEVIDSLWETRKLAADKPLYHVFERPHAAEFREFLYEQCQEHRDDGQILGVICHGNERGLMSFAGATGPNVLPYDDFWLTVEDAFVPSYHHAVVFGACENMADAQSQGSRAAANVDAIIGYSGKPQGRHVIKLLGSIFALASGDGFEAVKLAFEDAGANRARLVLNFQVIDEFLDFVAIDPHKNAGYLPDELDLAAGDPVLIERGWLPPVKLRLL